MKLRCLCLPGLLITLFMVPQPALLQPKAPDSTANAPDDVAALDLEVRVLATLKDSEQKVESVDPSKYGKDPSLIEDVRAFKATRKTPMSRYRLSYPEGKPDSKGHYGIDVYEKDDAKLLPLEGGSGDTAWKKPAFEGNEEKVFKDDLQDIEVWTRVVDGKTEFLARCAREKVTLEVLARHEQKESAALMVRERFKLFYQNALANQLFGEDDYWKWFVRFSQLCEQNLGEITCILATLAQQAEDRRKLLVQWQSLLQTENAAWPADNGWGYEWAALYRNSLATPLEKLGWSEETKLGSLAPILDLARMKAGRDRISKKYQALYAAQAQLIEEAQGYMQTIAASIEQTWKKAQANPKFVSAEAKAHLKDSYEYWQDQRKLLKMRLYEAAKWFKPVELPQVIKDLNLSDETNDEIGKLIKIKLLLGEATDLDRRVWLQRTAPAYSPEVKQSPYETLARAKRLDAVVVMHQILSANPNHRVARRALLEQEYKILNWIEGKQHREHTASLAAFHKFLTNRGYDAKQPETTWEGIKETVSVCWGNAWSSIMNRYTPEYLADAVTTDEENAAATLVSLNVLKRLSRRGKLLSEIRTMTDKDFRDHMVLELKDKEGNVTKKVPMPDAKVKHLRLDIAAAFNDTALGLAELAVGNGEAFCLKFNKTYYDVYDPERSWSEAIIDFCLSPAMLSMCAGPLTGWKLYGSNLRWGVIATEATEYTTLGEFTGKLVNLERLSTRLAQAPILNWIAEDARFLNGLSKATWLEELHQKGNVAFRMAATCGLYVGLIEIADENQIPGLRLLVRCTVELGAPQLVYAILGASRVPPGVVADAIEKSQKQAAAQAERLATRTQALEESEKLIQTISEGANEAERAAAAKKLVTNPVVMEGAKIAENANKTLPFIGINSATDLAWAMMNYAKAAARLDTKEMKRITAALRDLLRRGTKSVGEFFEQSTAALKIFRNAPTMSREQPTITFQKMRAETPPPFAQAKSVYQKPGGDSMLVGDELVRNGEFGAGKVAYEKGAAKSSAPETGNGELVPQCEEKKALAALAESELELKQTAQKAAIAAKSPDIAENLLKPIGDAEITAIETQGTLVKALSDSTFLVEANFDGKKGTYFVKIFEADKGGFGLPEQFVASLKDSCTTALIAERLKIPVPAARVTRLGYLKTPDGRAVAEQIAIVTRGFDGVELLELNLAQALPYKEEIAAVRFLRMLCGDPDGNGRNFMINRKTGQGIGIDFEQAWFANNKTIRIVPDARLDSVKEYLVYMRDLIRIQFERSQKAFHGCPTRIDEFLTYKDMKKYIEAAEKAFAGEAGKEELKKIIKEGYRISGQAVPNAETLERKAITVQERLIELPAMLEEKFGKPILPPTSWLAPCDNIRAICQSVEPLHLIAA